MTVPAPEQTRKIKGETDRKIYIVRFTGRKFENSGIPPFSLARCETGDG